ncbi:hypothetical protein VHUM_00828 [Vanrija humicola]|uniref:Uncharacterized protein n=1 Tax=Vanrija humicola TaxID=5417 RepID=A0A7D8V8U8_VANHU|nr:hypothetical protein VHUM_00828 [Vanrija humicola]
MDAFTNVFTIVASPAQEGTEAPRNAESGQYRGGFNWLSCVIA